MKTANIGSGQTEVIIAPTLNDGTAESLASIADYEFAETLRNMRRAGITVTQAEESDYTQTGFVVNGLESSVSDYLQTLTQEEPGELSLSDIVTQLLPAVASGLGISPLILVAGVKIAARYIEARTKAPEEATEALSDIAKAIVVYDEQEEVVGNSISPKEISLTVFTHDGKDEFAETWTTGTNN